MSRSRSWSADTFDYVIKPGIVPRLRALFGSSFTTLAYFVAVIFTTVRLLPLNHAYLDPANIGQYGVRDIVGAAADNLKMRRENIDQIIVFFVILGGMAMLALYAVALVLYVLTSPAFAQGVVDLGGVNLFSTPDQEKDLVFRMMDRTFGVEGVFGSQAMQSGEVPNGFHHGLHALFGIYNSALLFFAIFIFFYHIVVVVYETTQSGTPFGHRFDKLWAPMRLVFALGILIPLGSGLNTGQHMLLYIAKLGSNVASNSWIAFNQTLLNANAGNSLGSGGGDNVAKGNLRMYARPKMQDADRIIKHMMLISTCQEAYNTRWGIEKKVWPHVINDDRSREIALDAGFDGDDVIGSYEQALAFSEYDNIHIRFGDKNQAFYGARYPSGVYPHCGDVILPTPGQNGEDAVNPGATEISKAYFNRLIVELMQDDAHEFAQRQTYQYLPNLHGQCLESREQQILNSGPEDAVDCSAPGTEEINTIIAEKNTQIETVVEPDGPMDTAMQDSDANNTLLDNWQDYGWGGAGIWYNRIAANNGPIADAVQGRPYVGAMPDIMEEVREINAREKDRQNKSIYKPDEKNFSYNYYNAADPGEKFAELLYNTYEKLNAQEVGQGTGAGNSNNPVFQVANFVFYTKGLFDVFDNRNVHPLAQLASLGKTMLNSAITQLYFATGLSFIGQGLLPDIPIAGDIARGASQFYISMGGISAVMGIMLFYVIPFMPFLYFFFAIGKWIRSIAEAMVGIPLWALAHITIEGEGFPTQASENGYYLLLEIFVRPFIIVAALVGSLIIFAAEAVILNDIFDLVTRNIGGTDYVQFVNDTNSSGDGNEPMSVAYLRPRVDEFFYTVMYVIILYMLANVSFKLVDVVPQGILRWAGSSTQSFGDTAQDPLGDLQRNMGIAQMMVGRQAGGALQQAGGMAGGGARSAMGGLASRFGPAAQTSVSRLGM